MDSLYSEPIAKLILSHVARYAKGVGGCSEDVAALIRGFNPLAHHEFSEAVKELDRFVGSLDAESEEARLLPMSTGADGAYYIESAGEGQREPQEAKCSRCGELMPAWDACRDPQCPAEYEQEQAQQAAMKAATPTASALDEGEVVKRAIESANQVLLICKFAFAATLAYLPTEENETRNDVHKARKAIDEWRTGNYSALISRERQPETYTEIQKRIGELRGEITRLTYKITGDPSAGIVLTMDASPTPKEG